MAWCCVWCEESIGEDAPYHLVNGGTTRMHVECMARQVLGSIGHQRGRCSCHGGREGDPVGYTLRQVARMSLEYYLKHGGEWSTPAARNAPRSTATANGAIERK